MNPNAAATPILLKATRREPDLPALPWANRLRLPAASLILAAVLASAACGADSWPQFRGPGGRGLSDAKGLPLTWSESKNVKWKTPIHGKAWSSPVILGNQVWMTTATEDGRELSAVCVDRESGRIVHDLKLFTVPAPQYADRFNSYGSPTPVIEPGRVYVTFGYAGTACLDTATGKAVWERRDIKVNHYRGPGSSPIVFRDLLIMHFDGSDAQFVIALDKNTGKTVWQTPRSVDFGDLLPDGKPIREGDFRKAFSTPFLAELDGRPTLLSAASKATYAYDPVTGKELWRVEDKRFHSGSASPTAGHGLVFTCTGLARGELWAVRPGRGVLTEADVIWKVNRNVPTQPSPLLLGDLLFTIDDGGIASCLEAKTGKEIWRERVGGNYSASPICADGRLYFFSRDGKGTVVAAGGEFKMLGESQLDDGFMATPAIAGKALFARGKANLYRIEESPATAK